MNVQDLLTGLSLIAIILFSLSVHEFAHAFVANLYGDPTARLEGRQTINPLAHWDPVGTSLLVGLLLLRTFGLGVPVFGWGKPVPVNETNFDSPRIQGLQTALAGPMSNFFLALLAAVIFRFFQPEGFGASLLVNTVLLNLFLMFFNLIPVPPLDGSRILRLFISDRAYFALAGNPLIFFALIFMAFYFLIDFIGQASLSLANLFLGG